MLPFYGRYSMIFGGDYKRLTLFGLGSQDIWKIPDWGKDKVKLNSERI